MKVILHPAADGEFAEAVDFYEHRQAGLGEKFYREVLRSLDWIEANSSVPRLRKNYRRINLPVFSYYIAYLIQPDFILVVAIAHAHRKPGYWVTRMNE